jgi:uncharacterized membrane protein
MTIFYAVMAAVALIWAVVLTITIFNVLAAIQGKKNDKEEDGAQPNAVTTINNIAGMPAQTYHSTYWTNTTTTLH